MDDWGQVKWQVFGGESRFVLPGWDGGSAADAYRGRIQEALADIDLWIGGPTGQMVVHLAEWTLLGLDWVLLGLISQAVGWPDKASVSDLASGSRVCLVIAQGGIVVLSEPCVRANVIVGASGAGPLPSHV